MKNWDVPILAVGSLAGVITFINTGGAIVITALTIFILSLRARKAWKNRNNTPDDPTI